MADARMPERFLMDRRFARLDDAAFRSFVVALMWAVSNRTDGEILPGDLALIPGFRAGSAPALVAAGLWEPRTEGWQIADYLATQTTRTEFEVLENARRRDREKKARQRANKANESDPASDPDEGDSPGGQSRGTVPGDSTGKARQGQASTGKQVSEQPEEHDHTVVGGVSMSAVPDIQDDAEVHPFYQSGAAS